MPPNGKNCPAASAATFNSQPEKPENQKDKSGLLFATEMHRERQEPAVIEKAMNLERADASYEAWDKAIIAKSKRSSAAEPIQTAKPQASQSSPHTEDSSGSFKNALFNADNHERDYDATWRTTAAATGSGPMAKDPKNEDFGFWDFIDIINPLQHIPVVSTLYREMTGDEISAPARIMGGALYGGPLGFAASIGNAIVEEVTGKDAGELAMAMVFEDESPGNVVPDDEDPGPPVLAKANEGEAPAGPSGASLPNLTATTLASPERADQTAVLQEMAGNAALQDLLKEMGLTPNSPATMSGSTAQTAIRAALKPTPGALESDETLAASLPSATKTAQPPARNPASAEHPTVSKSARSGIPIDTSRHINPQAASHPAPEAEPRRAVEQTEKPQAAASISKIENGFTTPGNLPDNQALQASFADRMLQALDRYQAMSKQNNILPQINEVGPITPKPGAI